MAKSDSSPPEDHPTMFAASKGHETSDTDEEIVLAKFFFAVREPLPSPMDSHG